MSEAPQVQIVGVFRDRKDAENAIETLQSRGIEGSQLALLGSADAVREQLGLTVAEGSATDTEAKAPVDASEKQNMTPLLAGVPAYRGAVLAAGVAVPSGGTLAGAAVAALLGGAGGGGVGTGAAGLFRGTAERSYEEQLAAGGILLLNHPRSEEDVATAKAVLAQHADRRITTAPDRTMT